MSSTISPFSISSTCSAHGSYPGPSSRGLYWPNAGAPFADYLMGFPSLVQGTQMLDWGRQRDIYLGLFFQDDWKISPKLTLNLGLRYDVQIGTYEIHNRLVRG